MNKFCVYQVLKVPEGRKHKQPNFIFEAIEDGKGNLANSKSRRIVRFFIQNQDVDYDLTNTPFFRTATLIFILPLKTKVTMEYM